MAISINEASRISKALVDEHDISFEDGASLRSGHQVYLALGMELNDSTSLQAAILTAAAIAVRCFPGSVTAVLPSKGWDAKLLVSLPTGTLVQTLIRFGVNVIEGTQAEDSGSTLVFGTRHDVRQGLQITFDRWTGAVIPIEERRRLAERDGCAPAGVLAGALGMSEIFLRFARICPTALFRTIGLSLWRPDLPFDHIDAVGPQLEVLPAEFWLLGLGHLGQAYLWALSMLPYEDPAGLNILLNDFDTTVKANVETGLLTDFSDIGDLKGRVAERWLERSGFKPRRLDRRFDENVRLFRNEPRLALCGFDKSGPRWALERPGFSNIVNCGVGGRSDDFDLIVMQTFPQPFLTAETEWAIGVTDKEQERIERLARQNKAYRGKSLEEGCGEVELAGRAVAVPFVGAVAASLVISEALRMLHEGVRCAQFRIQLSAPSEKIVRYVPGRYVGDAQPNISFQKASVEFIAPLARVTTRTPLNISL